MTLGKFKTVEGFVWPECDEDAAAVVHRQVVDVEKALVFCKNFDLAVQAGGNMGVWPRYLSRVFRQVHTFEPEPLNYECLLLNCPELKIIKHGAALGDKHGFVKIEYPEGRRNMGACCVAPGSDIRVVKIDDLTLQKCDLVQLDVEGYEPRVILGGMETIRRHHPVLMLEDKGLSEKYGYPKGWPLDMLKPEGYKQVDSINRDVILVWEGS